MVSGPTSRALKGRGAGCLSGVGTYLPGRLEGRNWMMFYFYFMTSQVKHVHMQLLLLSSDSFILLREIYLVRMSTSEVAR